MFLLHAGKHYLMSSPITKFKINICFKLIRDVKIDVQTIKHLSTLQKNTLNIRCSQVKKELEAKVCR
jgi:hypothetical protein